MKKAFFPPPPAHHLISVNGVCLLLATNKSDHFIAVCKMKNNFGMYFLGVVFAFF